MKSCDDLLQQLIDLGIEVTRYDHAPVPTVAEAKILRGVVEGHHTKNLFLMDKAGRAFLVAAKADSRVDLKHLRDAIGATGRLSFGSGELLYEKLGVSPGTVTPFAIVNDANREVTLVLDKDLLDGQTLNFLPLVSTSTVGIGRDDFLRFVRTCDREPIATAMSEADREDSEATTS